MVDVKKLLTKMAAWMHSKEYTGYGAHVDISTRTSSNMYTIPSDGIIQTVCTYRANSYIQVYRGDGMILAQGSAPTGNLAGNIVISTPVYKGMKVYVTRSSTYSYAYFYPYTT